jgi:hypothetical protein
MAYENTNVSVSKSQDELRKLLLRHEGSSVAFISNPPKEGFEAMVPLDGKLYHVRIMAKMRHVEPRNIKGRYYRGRWIPPRTVNDERDIETRRIWRVIYYHFKSVFESADSGVMEFRELILPYIVTKDGGTVAEHILPKLDAALSGRPERLLAAAPEE